MKFIDEFRQKEEAYILAEKLRNLPRREMKIMEVCGSQTHAIMKYGLEELLPDNIRLIHGPGCPVCVTPPEMIDAAVEMSMRNDIILASYGDMLRVPGSGESLMGAKAGGADVRIVHSPLDALTMARNEKNRKVVFLAIGFETTAPANASAVLNAAKERLGNFHIISSHVLIPPALEYILSSDKLKLDGILAPGHVCSVTGYRWCEDISQKFLVPVTVTGFEPADLLQGILMTAEKIISGDPAVSNQYRRVVNREGNLKAVETMNKVFRTTGMNWRGLGYLPQSGLSLRDEYALFDALKIFPPVRKTYTDESGCIAGEILKGLKIPDECPLFGTRCVPENPVGAPMVSSEGTCAAYYLFRKQRSTVRG